MKSRKKRPKSAFAFNVASRRKAMKMSQREFAAFAGIGESTLKEIEADLSPGSQPVKETIAAVFGCTVEDLQQRPTSDTQKQMADLIATLQKENDFLREQIAQYGPPKPKK